MATSFSQRFEKIRKEQEEAKNNSSKKQSTTNKTSFADRFKKINLESTIGFDTFESDLNSMGTAINSIYDGWQTEETMNNTRSSIEAMQKRINAYQEYQKLYGNGRGADLTDMSNRYKSTLEGWEDLTYHYSKYKSADDYKKALEEVDKAAKEREGMKTADLSVVQTEIDDLEAKLKNAEDINSNIHYGATTRANAQEIVAKNNQYSKELQDYLSSYGYKSIDELKKALSDKKVYKSKAQRIQDGISLSSVADETSENYDTNFDDYSAKGTALGNEKNDKLWSSGYKNQIAYLRANPELLEDYDEVTDESGAMLESILDSQLPYVAAKYMTDGEAKIHDYYVYLESQGLAEEGSATRYIKSIEENLKQRQGTDIAEEREGLLSKYAFGYNAGIDQFTQGLGNLFNTNDSYIPATGIQNASSIIREDINKNHGTIGQGAYDLITTTSNMAPSILASAVSNTVVPGSGAIVGATLMGTSAAGNAYQEMLNQGYDKGQARTYSTLVGVSEAGLQYAFGGISKLGGKLTGKTINAIANGVDNALGRFAIKYGLNMASEGFEEAAQEILNPFFENLAFGYTKNNFSDIEWQEVAYSGVLGALSAGFLEGGSIATSTFSENSSAKKSGANIRSNEKIGDMLETVALSPEGTASYDLYTQYAKKGVNAENISDLQIGRLHGTARADAQNTLSSRKSTQKEKINAFETLHKLEKINTDDIAVKRASELTKGEVTGITSTGNLASIEGIKIDNNDTTIVTNEGEVSINDMTFTQRDADLVSRAEQIGKEYGETLANLFLTEDDGKSEIDNYANSFNLVMQYATHNYTQETILEKKGMLSSAQVKAIYEATVKANFDLQENAKNEIATKYGKSMFIEGVFDDSVIDYNNSTSDGSKVNWNSLTSTQRSAIRFTKLFSKATGVNIKFIKSSVVKGKHEGKNGSYDPATNTIEIDVYAGRVDAKVLNDSIIPTLSHEITHWMKAKSPAIYNSIREDVIKTLKTGKGLTSEEIIDKEINRLNQKHPNKKHTPEDAIDELVARACEDMLSNSNEARKLLNKMSAEEQQNFIDKVKATFDNLIQWVNDLLAHYKSNSEEAKILREYKHMLKKISKQWDAMLVDSIQTNQALKKEGIKAQKNTPEGDLQFALREGAKEEVKSALANKLYNQEIKLTDSSPSILLSQKGVKNLPLMMKASHIRENIFTEEEAKKKGLKVNQYINYHGLGEDLFFKVIDGLDEVKEAYRGTKNADKPERRENYFLLVSQYTDKDGNIINVPVYINEKGLYNRVFIDTNKIATVFGKTEFRKYIREQLNKGNLVRIKNRSVQTSESTSPINADYGKNTSKDIIRNPNEKVKENDVKNSDRDYSYDVLINKPNIKIPQIANVSPSEISLYKENRNLFAKKMIEIATKVGNSKNTTTATYLYCKDLGENVQVTRNSFKHGAARIDASYISICKNISGILENSIVVNELEERENTSGGYVLLGLTESKDSYIIVRSIVDKKTWKLEDYNELYAIRKKSIKKEDVGFIAPALHSKNGYGTSSTISISHFLDFVNNQKLSNSVLSADVIKRLNSSRAFDENVTPSLLYSDRDNISVYDKIGEVDRLLKENTKLKEDVERLKERLKLERQVTHGNYFNENQLNAVAARLRNISNSGLSKDKLIPLLKDVYSYIAHSTDLNWYYNMFAKCYDIAKTMLNESRPIKVKNDYYKSVLREIHNKKIFLNGKQIQEAKHRFGNKYQSALIGKFSISKDGIPLDIQWQEWAKTYPEFFDASISDAEQINELYDIYDSLREASETVLEFEEEERTRWLAQEIYNQYWNVSHIRTTADKYDRQIKQLNFEHRITMKELRDSYEDRLKAQHKVDKERSKELVQKIRERKDKEIAEVKKLSKERMDKYKEEAQRKTKIQSITAKALTLNEWLLKNSKEKHIHESLKGPVANLLQAIDFSSKQLLGMRGGNYNGMPTQKDISLKKALSQVKDMMLEASVGKEELVDLYGHDLDDDIKALLESVDNIMRTVGDNEFILNKMTLNDLNTLDNMLKTIKQAVTKMNQFHSVHHAQGIASLGQEEIRYAEKLGNEKVYVEGSFKSGANKTLKWTNSVPYYAFKRFGEAGKKIFEAFQDGWDKLAFNVKEIIDFTKKTYKTKEVREWEKEIKSFDVLVPATDYEKSDPNFKPKYQMVQMTTAQVMHLYLLNKRAAAKPHLLGEGIKVTDIETKKNEVISQPDDVKFEQSEIDKIIKSLTKRQIEVADALSKFMNTVCSDWGNEISMARFGYKAFGEPNYVPMNVDKDGISTPDPADKNNSLFKLLNMSFTKGLAEGATNTLVISSIFDVFAQHTSDMAKYNALALPVLDTFKWYNYKEIAYLGDEAKVRNTVKKSIGKAFGKDGQSYITTFLEDINGQNNLSRDKMSVKFFKNAKLASVGMNLRVILLQPTSYFRASANIDNKYLIQALAHKPKTAHAEKYCGMALWKSLGYYDTNIQRGVAEQIKHAETGYEKLIEWSMKGAGEADRLTLGYLWNAAELEIRKTRKDLKVGSEEFFFEVGKRLREIIYSTQVVDSTLTRSEFMRSSDGRDKFLSMFASEPTLAYNILQDAYIQTSLDARELGDKKVAFKKNGKKIARAVTAYTVTNAVAALVESGFDILRDDDDEELDIVEFMKLYLSNFATDMSIIGKIPYLKDGLSILQGYSPSRSDIQWIESAYKTYLGITKHLQGEGNPVTTIKNGIKTFSYVSGLPFFNAYRDMMATLYKLDILSKEDIEDLFS